MSEERESYVTDTLFTSEVKSVTLEAQAHSGFEDVRNASGKLLCRINAERELLQWREGKHLEVIDISHVFRQWSLKWQRP